MGTLYRGAGLLITHDMIAVQVPHWRRLRIHELRDPYAVVVRARWPIGSPAYEFSATYGRHTICLFRTADATTFGQVRRALVRAFEHERERQEQRGMSERRTA
jgi:hypothetical protein